MCHAALANTDLCWGVFGFAVLAAVIAAIGYKDSLVRKLEPAQKEYQAALDRLAKEPGTAALRREALARGRELMQVVETLKKWNHSPLPMVSEMSIQNDLQACDTGYRP